MAGDFNKLHNILIRMGFKVVACSDNDLKPEVVTFYENDKGTTVMIEEPDDKQIVKTLKQKEHPVTGNTTPEEAAKLLQDSIVKRDTQ